MTNTHTVTTARTVDSDLANAELHVKTESGLNLGTVETTAPCLSKHNLDSYPMPVESHSADDVKPSTVCGVFCPDHTVDVIPDAWRTTPATIAARTAKRMTHAKVVSEVPVVSTRPATTVGVVFHLRHTSGCVLRGLPGTDGYSNAACEAILRGMPVENRAMWTKVAV